MAREKISAAAKKRVLVSDGAWGTMLQERGLLPGDCPDKMCIENPQVVYEVAKAYIDAGADMVETNSFGSTSIRLEHYNLSDKAAVINKAAAELSRRAAGEECWVIGSIGSCGKILMMGDICEREMYDSFTEQAKALEEGGADAVCIETMTDIEEAVVAIKAAKENTTLEIICTFTYDPTVRGEYRTMMGISPEQGTMAAIAAGADIVGTNCGNGFEKMIQIVRQIRGAAPETPILVHANAGMPTNINGVDNYPDSPEFMASLTGNLIEAGANIIGGCCGTTPEHIRQIKAVVDKYNKK
ncbi:MAG: homocysteine S-methyltransferase family protein [Phycisphaerae bacterium]